MIVSPMDFLTMRKKLEAGQYHSIRALADDFFLICKNAIVFNEPNSELANIAEALMSDGSDLISAHSLAHGGDPLAGFGFADGDNLNGQPPNFTQSGGGGRGRGGRVGSGGRALVGAAGMVEEERDPSRNARLQFWPNTRIHRAVPRLASTVGGSVVGVYVVLTGFLFPLRERYLWWMIRSCCLAAS
jgi:hypothetical protein